MRERMVLLIDDEANWVDLARPIFANKGAPLAHFLTFQDALPSLAQGYLDFLLVNANLVSDWDTLQKEMWSGRVCKIVILSNVHSASLAVEAFRRGMDYEDKPFGEEGVSALIDRLRTSGRGKYIHTISVLIVEDRVEWREIFSNTLASMPRLKVTLVDNYSDALTALTGNHFPIIITDIRLEDKDWTNIEGLVLLKSIYETRVSTAVIVTTGFASVELAREAILKYRAFDFFLKSPDAGQFELERFRESIYRAIQQSLLYGATSENHKP